MWINMKVNNLIKTLYDSSIYWFPFKSGGIYLESRRLTPPQFKPQWENKWWQVWAHLFKSLTFLEKKPKKQKPNAYPTQGPARRSTLPTATDPSYLSVRHRHIWTLEWKITQVKAASHHKNFRFELVSSPYSKVNHLRKYQADNVDYGVIKRKHFSHNLKVCCSLFSTFSIKYTKGYIVLVGGVVSP